MGSKSSPPCEESVVWFVVEKIKYIGPTVLAMFRDVLNVPGQVGAQYDNNDGNNRAPQPINARTVYFFDRTKACFPYKESEDAPNEITDHYEKVSKPKEQYYHFDNLEASNLPGAVVVSKKEAEKIADAER